MSVTAGIVRAAFALYPFRCGQGYIIGKTPLRRMRFVEEILPIKTRAGYRMKCLPNDLIGKHLALTGQFDHTIVDVLVSRCRDGDRIVDIGANIGYVSCSLLHALPNSRVVSVEPQPQVYTVLADNIREVGKGRGQAINAAVSDREGEGRMASVNGNTGGGHLTEDADANIFHVSLMSGRRLMEASQIDRVDAIKIDVEGHELSVLSTLEPIIAKFRPHTVVFEHEKDLCRADAPIRQIFDRLRYQLSGIRKGLFGWQALPLSSKSPQLFRDYLAVSSDD